MNGSPQDAEDLFRTVRSTSAGPVYWEATIQLAELMWLSGRPMEATPLVGELLTTDLPVTLRARMLFRLDLHILSDHVVDRRTFLADLAEVNTALRALPERPGLARLRAEGLALEAALRWADSKDGSALLAEAIELDAREPARRIHDGPHIGRIWQLIGDYRDDDARAEAAQLYQPALDAGDDLSLPEILLQWGYLEARAGAWPAAHDRYHESLRVAESMHQEPNFVIARTLDLGLTGLDGATHDALREPELGRLGQWIIDGVDRESFEVVIGVVPPPVRYVLVHAFRPGYRKRCRVLWGGTPAANVPSLPLALLDAEA